MIWIIIYLIIGFIYALIWADDDGKLQGPEDLIALVVVVFIWPIVALGQLIDRT